MSDRIEAIEAKWNNLHSEMFHDDIRYLLSEVKRLNGLFEEVEKRIIKSTFDVAARVKKLEAVRDAAKEYFTLDEQEHVQLNPRYFKAYHAVKEALKAAEQE